MLVPQAVFTSRRTNTGRGYHLAARSPGIPSEIVQALCRWSPSHGSLLSEAADTSSLNCFPVGTQWVVISRTVYGGPEYSGRGALQVMTAILILRWQQLAGYEANPIALARTAFVLGHLRLTAATADFLPPVPLPERPVCAAWNESRAAAGDDGFLSRAEQLLHQEQRLALVGLEEPEAAIEQVLLRMPREKRLALSFASGLKPSQHRPFRIHALSQIDHATHRRLSAQGVRFLAANSEPSTRPCVGGGND